MRCYGAIVLFLCGVVLAEPVDLTCELPTQNEDGTPLTDLADIRLYWGSESGNYTQFESMGLDCVHTVDISGTTYFVATAINSIGQESKYSGEAVKTLSVDPPGVTTVQIDWRESSAVSWSNVRNNSTGSNSGATASITHGLSISDGDLVIVGVHTNNDDATITDTTGSGAAFTAAVDSKSDMSGETATYSVLWKVAASEPSAYSFTHGGSGRWSISIIVVTPDSGTPVIDVSPVFNHEGSNSTNAVATSITTSANSFGYVWGGDDNLSAYGSLTADNGYTAVNGQDNQSQVNAYQIDDAGGSTGTITIGTGPNDKTYTAHMSWVHGAAASGQPAVKRFGGVPGMAINSGVW